MKHKAGNNCIIHSGLELFLVPSQQGLCVALTLFILSLWADFHPLVLPLGPGTLLWDLSSFSQLSVKPSSISPAVVAHTHTQRPLPGLPEMQYIL